jgi:hypothetical protein
MLLTLLTPSRWGTDGKDEAGRVWYHLDGDDDFYTANSLKARKALRKDAAIKKVIGIYWSAVPQDNFTGPQQHEQQHPPRAHNARRKLDATNN